MRTFYLSSLFLFASLGVASAQEAPDVSALNELAQDRRIAAWEQVRVTEAAAKSAELAAQAAEGAAGGTPAIAGSAADVLIKQTRRAAAAAQRAVADAKAHAHKAQTAALVAQRKVYARMYEKYLIGAWRVDQKTVHPNTPPEAKARSKKMFFEFRVDGTATMINGNGKKVIGTFEVEGEDTYSILKIISGKSKRIMRISMHRDGLVFGKTRFERSKPMVKSPDVPGFKLSW